MGATSSKDQNDDFEGKRESLMIRHADMVKDIAEDRRDHRNIDQMSKFRLVLSQSTKKTSSSTNSKCLSINGIDYTIDQFINKGGFGEIYKAQRKDTGQNVAIKIMRNTPDIRQETENEIEFLRLTKSIRINNHPVIDYYGCQITNEQIYIAMELAVCDLYDFWFEQIQEKNGKDKFIFEKLNIIHGDIKPQNMVIVQGNQSFAVKLIDFGTVEKMSTQRHQLTVGADKPHTLFFASPEFLKRDANHIISRHLNKKSDAWAAGVMFYILFFERLPWNDQYDYENFCNDPHAEDIVVPQQGGYQLIIELLLKKDPKQRSTAKETFMQIKSHPTMGNILTFIQQTFYPVDDVCHINVPDHIKQQLGKLAKPGHSSLSRGSSGSRRPCRYGRECYRRDSDHREEFAHPGDRDYNQTNQSEKTKCRYGSNCYRTDQTHLHKYVHPSKHQSSRKERCKFGDKCQKRNDREHTNKYFHD